MDASGLHQFLNKGRLEGRQQSTEANAVIQKAFKEKEGVLQTGFVAQEEEKAAKELNYDFSGVDKPKNANDVYGLRYSDFVVPLVKAVQELDEENKNLKDELSDLKSRLAKLEALFSNNNNAITSRSFYLEQNTPNPAIGTTFIKYHISETATSKRLDFTNAKGQLIKTIMLVNKDVGQISLNTAILAAGTYNYSLYVDGKQVDSKRLMIDR